MYFFSNKLRPVVNTVSFKSSQLSLNSIFIRALGTFIRGACRLVLPITDRPLDLLDLSVTSLLLPDLL